MPALSSLTITLTDTHIIDGWVEAANRNSTTPEAFALDFLTTQGHSYANLFGVGVITSAAFMARFKPAEYAAIMEAMGVSEDIAGLVGELTSTAHVHLNDPRLEPGLEALAAVGLIKPERVAELLAYTRPEVSGAPEDGNNK